MSSPSGQFPGRRVVVTGGAGFIGSYLVELLLRRGAERVTVVDGAPRDHWWRLAGSLDHPSFGGLQLDVRDGEALSGAFRGHDVVIHMAAGTDMRRGASDPRWDFEHGILATQSVLEAVRGTGVPKVLFISSSAVYGELASDHPAAEDEGPLLPISMYGAGKLAGEGLMSAYAALFDVTVRIVRLGTVLGGRMDHGAVHSFVTQVVRGEPRLRVLGDGTQARTFILAEECVEGMLHVLGQDGPRCAVFNLSGEGTISTREIAEIVLEETGRTEVQVEYAGGDRGWTGDVPVVALSLDRLHRTGWRASHTSREAVRECIRQLIAVRAADPDAPDRAVAADLAAAGDTR